MLKKNESNSSSDNEGKKDSINNYIFPEYEESQIKEAFDVFDFNGNNFISALELKEIFHYIKEEVTDEEIDEMINLADKEGDGQVNWANFYEFISGKVINEDIKQMEKTPGLYPENNFNKVQHLEKEKIEFINIDDKKFNKNKIKEESIKSNNINKEENDKNINQINNLENEDINDDNYNDEDEDKNVDNYVKEILQKRQERLQNNYLANNAKIYAIKDKNNQKSKKMLFAEDNFNQKNKEIIYNSFSESPINSSKEEENNNYENIIKENKYLKVNNNIDDERNKTKNSNFLPLDRTNSIKKINPILNEVNNYDEKDKKKEIKTINIKNKKNKKNDLKNKLITKNNIDYESNSEQEKRDNQIIKKKNKNLFFQAKNFNIKNSNISKDNSENFQKYLEPDKTEEIENRNNNKKDDDNYYDKYNGNGSKMEENNNKFNKNFFPFPKNSIKRLKINDEKIKKKKIENRIKNEEEEEEEEEEENDEQED